MSRTMRNTPHWVSKTQPLNWWWRGTRQNIRIVKGADGALRFPICASANKGVLNNWDDIYARGGRRHEPAATLAGSRLWRFDSPGCANGESVW